MISLVKKLWPEIKTYRFRFINLMFLGIIVSALKNLVPWLMNLFQEAMTKGDREKVITIPILIALAWIVPNIGRYFHMYFTKFTADQIAVTLRKRLMDKTLRLNLGFFQDFATGYGGLISRMINDVTEIQVGMYRLSDLIREPFSALFAIASLLYIDWRLTLFVFILLPIVSVVMRSLARSLRKYGNLNQQAMESLTKTLKEGLDGLRIIQSFNLQDYMRKRFDEQSNHYLDSRRKIITREEASGPINESLVAVALGLVLIYIGFQFMEKKLGMGDFLGFMFAMGLLQDATKKIQEGYVKLQLAGVALDRLHGVLGSREVMLDPIQPKPFPEHWRTIEFRNVSFKFKNTYVLRNINLKVQRGEQVAFVGSSGSGKSTLVNLLERFFDPESGQIFIDGIDIRDFRLDELRKHIALVSQDVFLFGDTIETNILAGDFTKAKHDVARASELANADKFISKTGRGYQSQVGDLGHMLSGGEKQRISIARAILKDAPILVLDEATSALDSQNERDVQDGLNKLMSGRTTFVIAHRLSTIVGAHRIFVLHKGEIIEQGTHSELLDRGGEYHKLYQMQR